MWLVSVILNLLNVKAMDQWAFLSSQGFSCDRKKICSWQTLCIIITFGIYSRIP
jgi:hypothetical protein